MTITHEEVGSFLRRPAAGSDLLRQLRREYAALFDEIAAGALQRELDDRLPIEQVAALKQTGFGALRVPAAYGGWGASWTDVTQLWIDLAAADANLPQALRGHFALVEDRVWQDGSGLSQRSWFERFAAGEIAGNAWSEVGSTAIDTQRTVLTDDGAGVLRLDGAKYYTTGTIYAEWADVYARRVRPGHADDFVIVLVDTRAPGVTVTDDWGGFGQKGTGSGTTLFDGVRIDPAHVLPFEDRFPYQTALYQLNLLATLVGIGRRALTDTVTAVRERERNYSHANAARVRDDAQVLATVGTIASSVYAAEAATLRVASALQEASETVGDPTAAQRAAEAAELESSAAQVVVTQLVLDSATDLFDTLGASATAVGSGLDRHWRNARTVSSHNPRNLKARVVGGSLVNGTPPPYAWAIGRTERISETTDNSPKD